MEEIKFLKERAKDFWEEVGGLRQKGKYNLSAFNLEQACQLWLKYLIGKKIGDWPKTHYLSELVFELAKVYEDKKILEFYNQNEIFFNDLEDAYFTSRYFPKKFSENLINQLESKTKEFFKLTEDIAEEKF